MFKVKFKDMEKNDKKFRIVNLILMLIFFVTCISLGIYYIAVGNPDNRVFISFSMSIVPLLPLIVELIFRRRLSNMIFLCYTIYLIFAGLIGCVFNLYNLVWWYDIIIHTLAGYVFCLLAIFILSRLTDYNKLNVWAILFVCLSFTLAAELIWELMEWFVDVCFNHPAQGPHVPGYDAPLITDTMFDILCNTCGGILFALHFIIGKLSKVSLGIKFYEKELVYNKNKQINSIKKEINTEKENKENNEIISEKEHESNNVSSIFIEEKVLIIKAMKLVTIQQKTINK